jgi:hypothetical protein
MLTIHKHSSAVDNRRKLIQQEREFWKHHFFAHVALRSPTSVSDEMSERLWLSEKYKLLSPSRFIQEVKQASEDGRAAELSVARLVMESRAWRSDEEQQAISAELHTAERDVKYQDRTESLELLDVAEGLLEDNISSFDAIRTGDQDVRLKMSQSVDERLKNISGINANREQFQKEHGTVFSL